MTLLEEMLTTRDYTSVESPTTRRHLNGEKVTVANSGIGGPVNKLVHNEEQVHKGLNLTSVVTHAQERGDPAGGSDEPNENDNRSEQQLGNGREEHDVSKISKHDRRKNITRTSLDEQNLKNRTRLSVRNNGNVKSERDVLSKKGLLRTSNLKAQVCHQIEEANERETMHLLNAQNETQANPQRRVRHHPKKSQRSSS